MQSMKTNNISREYKIDYISEKITVSKKFLKAAGVYNSPEYKLMKELRADYPAFAFEEKKIDKKAGMWHIPVYSLRLSEEFYQYLLYLV